MGAAAPSREDVVGPAAHFRESSKMAAEAVTSAERVRGRCALQAIRRIGGLPGCSVLNRSTVAIFWVAWGCIDGVRWRVLAGCIQAEWS